MLTVGIDEVGRGCWAGPLVAAAVILPDGFEHKYTLRDSKKLTKKQRESLSEIIKKEALSVGIGWVWPEAIDSGGITAAVKTAMQEALLGIDKAYEEIIVDGNINYLSEYPKSRAIIKADDIFPSVSAASIVAKVARDNYMAEISAEYPAYGFDKHVGYGTAVHITALKEFGLSPIHRRSYKPVAALLELCI